MFSTPSFIAARAFHTSSRLSVGDAEQAADTATKVTLSLTTPYHAFYKDAEVDLVQIPGVIGEYGVTSGHAPVLDQLKPGVIKVKVHVEREKNNRIPLLHCPARLTLEEKVWFDRRRRQIEYCASVGGAIGAAVTAAMTSNCSGHFHDVQFLTITGGVLIGGGVGYLYADTKTLERVHDLSATSNLRKQYQQL
ncbi:hypothetical protein PsorP6_002879 [Peronosclerospora sorghi]|uniref:Uncharacterized protein n=1 Tax=Peronosclerospora sorghi TaxID=230839 RepID=A0ACC0VK02_9STRA|nr:hypothetical protein PsorP6_002879 [Peronosclerospora sorghi]